jgi:hypothetical protein
VCIPTHREIHGSEEKQEFHADQVGETSQSMREGDVASDSISVGRQTPIARVTKESNEQESFDKEAILAHFVQYGRLVGRVLELFHKSIHGRVSSPQQVLLLRSEVDLWFNSLPDALQTFPTKSGHVPQRLSPYSAERFAPFFSVLYQHLIILMNRPSPSLHQPRPEFQAGLQASIGAARLIISTVETDLHMMWPGYLSSVWMAGLIIAFACQLRSYSTRKGYR